MISEKIVDNFWSAYASGRVPAGLDASVTAEDGFRIQIAIQERHDRAGDIRIGWKVAATNAAVQKQLGISEPAFGSLRRSRKFLDGHALSVANLIGPHAECELCFEVNDQISAAETLSDVAGAIERCYPAFEIIEKRVPITQFVTAMADNAEHTAIVLGQPVNARSVEAYDKVACRLVVNGLEAGISTGEAVLGNPLNAILWLKKRLDLYGQNLSGGMLIMTGSFLRQQPIVAGDVVEADFSEIGKVKFKTVA